MLLLIVLVLFSPTNAEPFCATDKYLHACGHSGITQKECEAEGCCYDAEVPEGSPLCFHMNDGYDYCSTTAERTECGHTDEGLDEETCTTRGCCWDDSASKDGPACFHRNSIHNKAKCAPDTDRVPCGDAETTQDICEGMGCCWSPTEKANTPWCFQMPVTEDINDNEYDSCCPTTARSDCGYPGITEQGCLNRGCCYDPYDQSGSGPWCYSKNCIDPSLESCAADKYRIECGHFQIKEHECKQRNCCWSPLGGGSDDPWCFFKNDGPNPYDTCCPSYTRVECGFYGIDEAECNRRGCCWGPLKEQSTEPWCYQQNCMDPSEDICSPEDERIECGYYGIKRRECESRNCCWSPLEEDSKDPWCFFRNLARGQCCDADGGRVECGFPGIKQQKCEARGCCWSPLEEGSVEPWCFHKNSDDCAPPTTTEVVEVAEEPTPTTPPPTTAEVVASPTESPVEPPAETSAPAPTSTAPPPVPVLPTETPTETPQRVEEGETAAPPVTEGTIKPSLEEPTIECELCKKQVHESMKEEEYFGEVYHHLASSKEVYIEHIFEKLGFEVWEGTEEQQGQLKELEELPWATLMAMASIEAPYPGPEAPPSEAERARTDVQNAEEEESEQGVSKKKCTQCKEEHEGGYTMSSTTVTHSSFDEIASEITGHEFESGKKTDQTKEEVSAKESSSTGTHEEEPVIAYEEESGSSSSYEGSESEHMSTATKEEHSETGQGEGQSEKLTTAYAEEETETTESHGGEASEKEGETVVGTEEHSSGSSFSQHEGSEAEEYEGGSSSQYSSASKSEAASKETEPEDEVEETYTMSSTSSRHHTDTEEGSSTEQTTSTSATKTKEIAGAEAKTDVKTKTETKTTTATSTSTKSFEDIKGKAKELLACTTMHKMQCGEKNIEEEACLELDCCWKLDTTGENPNCYEKKKWT